MRQTIAGRVYDTNTLTRVTFWHNHCPPNHPQFQRYFVYQAGVDRYVVWVRTGSHRGNLDTLFVLDRCDLDVLLAGTKQLDRRRSIVRVLAQLPHTLSATKGA